MIKLRQDISLEELRSHMRTEKDAKVYRRLLGIVHLLEGGTRAEARRLSQLSINIFRNWIVRFNTLGIAGLNSIKSTGRPRKMNEEMRAELKSKILKGPSPEEGIVRYRLVDLQDYLKTNHGISVCTSSVWYTLDDLDLSWKTGRQRHPKADEVVQESFKKTSSTR